MLSRPLRYVASTALALATFAGAAMVASAHAQYGGSNPPANATVTALPSTLTVMYTQELADIHISVKGPDGAEETTAPATFDLENRHNASVPIHDAGPGTYTVLWHNVSGDDGDPNDGTFVFTEAGAPAAAATLAPTPPPATTSAAAPLPVAASTTQAPAPVCIDNGAVDPHIHDVRADTYCKREALREKYAGQIDVATFNGALADGEGLESALSDAMADFQAEQAAAKKH